MSNECTCEKCEADTLISKLIEENERLTQENESLKRGLRNGSIVSSPDPGPVMKSDAFSWG